MFLVLSWGKTGGKERGVYTSKELLSLAPWLHPYLFSCALSSGGSYLTVGVGDKVYCDAKGHWGRFDVLPPTMGGTLTKKSSEGEPFAAQGEAK